MRERIDDERKRETIHHSHAVWCLGSFGAWYWLKMIETIYPSATLTTCIGLSDHIAHIHSLTSVRRDLCRGCRAAKPGRILCCSCCSLWPPAHNRHLSERRTLTLPCPTGRRTDPASPERKHTCTQTVQCLICPCIMAGFCVFYNSNVNTSGGYLETESFFQSVLVRQVTDIIQNERCLYFTESHEMALNLFLASPAFFFKRFCSLCLSGKWLSPPHPPH